MKRFLSLVLAVLLLLSISCTAAFADESEQPIIQNLKTNGRVNPIGIDTPQPEFSWQMFSSAVGAGQKAYHIVVTDEQGNTVWDTGIVESPVSVGILYEGDALQPTTEYNWTLTVTDRDGRELTADPAFFETSLLDATFEAWDGAEWIGSPDLPLDAPSKAVFHISADVTLAEGSSTASFILGAGDFRLENRAFNPWLAEGENYVRVEFDYTDATPEGGVKINVYRVGYLPEDDPAVPFAVVQLRQENEHGTLYNMVGFQTRLKWGEQKRVFSMIPGLEHAEFARYGVMHRNTYLNSPDMLASNYALAADPLMRFAGQLTGVEGYMESTASGLVAAVGLACALSGRPEPDFTGMTVLGALAKHVVTRTPNFQPMNANFGLLEPLTERVRGKRERYQRQAERSLQVLTEVKNRYEL